MIRTRYDKANEHGRWIILMNIHTWIAWVNMFSSLNPYFMLLIKFLFHVQIIELEKKLTQVENELKSMKETRKKKTD
jgi:hypothetical protein